MTVTLSPEYRVNIEVLDSQHERLFNMIEDLRQAIVAGSGAQEAERILGELCDYALTHFTEEEHLMKEAGYAALSAHRVAHRDFIARLEEMQRGAAGGKKNTLTLELSAFLNDWLRKHIRIADQLYVPLLTSKAGK